jgi:PKD repeat protein
VRKMTLVAVVAAGLLACLSGCMEPNSPPIARITASPSSGTAPLAVVFDAGSSSDADGVITAYSWSFGDGASAQGEAVTHTYGSPGYYVVTLRVTDDVGASDTATRAISVAGAPAAPIAVGAQRLLDEYDANEVAADMKYGGKLLAVAGYVDSINVNEFTGEPYVNLVGAPGEWTLFWVRCTFPLSAQASLAGLSKGAFVTIIGTCDGELLGSVMLDDCRF